MNNLFLIKPVARIYTDFHERFGIPRQAGLVEDLRAWIIFDPEFRNVSAVKGLEGFSHLWLIWGFSETAIDMTADPVKWAPQVTPPRLGGKIKEGVFATRSPYRPNSLGLSSVRLLQIDLDSDDAPVLTVGGADLLNGTPIFDIKPYIAYTDCHPDAVSGFAVSEKTTLKVEFPGELLARIDPDRQEVLLKLLAMDPRGAYEKQPGYRYGLHFAEYDIRFIVEDDVLKVFEVCLRPQDDGQQQFRKLK